MPNLTRLTPLIALLSAAPLLQAQPVKLRPPAFPLVACDPYFSIWSRADRLTDVATTHWTGRAQPLTSLVRIDGRSYRLMGAAPTSASPLAQVGYEVLPTRTVYDFAGHGVSVRLTFLTPALPSDIDVLSRPVTYLTWDAKSTDGQKHNVQIYFDTSALPTVDDPAQRVTWSSSATKTLLTSRFGSVDQPVLGKVGDDRRIDWGYLYSAAPNAKGTSASIVRDGAVEFVANGRLPNHAETSSKVAANQAPVAATTFDLGQVGSSTVSRWLILAYDDEYSIQYFNQDLRPYWRRKGMDAAKLLDVSAREYGKLRSSCELFDRELMADLRKAGGEKYALLTALAYRQCFAGNKIAADRNGQPLLFPKENTSNGCIGTVDVIFPMAPQFLLFGPSLTKAMIVSNLDYASSSRWKWPFAPHDLGTYPKANGQVYGGGERTEDDQMPVEETGNMLILTAALAKMEGNAEFAGKYWKTLTRWAEFLASKGFDPENQLSTDDFMGHLAHNTNLSVKAALGIASYGYLCDVRGHKAEGAKYMALARGFAQRWTKEASDGDHYRLAFDKPGSWSQKYNMVWDRILGFGLWPESVKRTEVAYYRKVANRYGVALDSRQRGVPAKIDWSLWSATLTGNRADFDAIVDGVFKYVNESPERVGMGDLYNTETGHHIGMNHRPVVGAFLLPLLYDDAIWKKWASLDVTRAHGWAPLPKPLVFKVVVPTSENQAINYRYTEARPETDWTKPSYQDFSWPAGPGGFGSRGTPGAVVRTHWESSDIWLRRDFDLPSIPSGDLFLRVYHDEDVEVYLNGVLVYAGSGWTTAYENVSFPKTALKAGRNVFAVHCHQTSGGQGVDVGIVSGMKAKG